MVFKPGIFSEKQIDVMANCTATINLLEGAVRSGKTIASIIAVVNLIVNGPHGNILFVGKTDRTLFRNILQPIEEIYGPSNFKFRRGTGEGEIFGRHFYTAGANDERAYTKIQGLTLYLAYGDEVAAWPESFFQMLISRLSEPGARFIGSLNPEGPYHWLKTKFLDREKELSLKSWHFRLENNLNLDPNYVDNLKKFYTGVFYRRYINGEWCLAEGAIYDMFSEEKHVAEVTPDIWINVVQKYVFVDYGTSNKCIFQLWGILGGKRYLKKEYCYDSKEHGRQKTDSEYASDMVSFIGSEEVMFIGVDPSALSFKNELARRGLCIQDADNDVLDGIREVSTELSLNKIQIDPSCTNCIREFSGYVWDTRAGERGEDKPLKQNDHSMDVLRYFIHTVPLIEYMYNHAKEQEVGYSFSEYSNDVYENY